MMHAKAKNCTLATSLLAMMLVIVSGCGGDDPVEPSPTPSGPLSFTDFQPAAVVIGQVDGTRAAANAGSTGTNALGIAIPYGKVSSGSLYVPDQANRRLLGYNSTPTANGATADFVVGQADFTSSVQATSDTRFSATNCHAAGGELFVADPLNNRILIWNSMPKGDVAADVVVGQSDFTSSGSATTQSGLNNPFAVTTGGGKLIVSDFGHNRVLIWNSIPTVNNAPADVVLGQADFTSSGLSLSQSSVGLPRGIWTDGNRLIVSDSVERRVMIWNSIPTTNNQPADVVVGASDFTTTGSLFAQPGGVVSDGTSLFAVDINNHRVLIFRPVPTANGASPSGVLGQSNFTNATRNDDNQDGVQDATPSRRTMAIPTDVSIAGRRLFVTDQVNHRILVFESN